MDKHGTTQKLYVEVRGVDRDVEGNPNDLSHKEIVEIEGQAQQAVECGDPRGESGIATIGGFSRKPPLRAVLPFGWNPNSGARQSSKDFMVLGEMRSRLTGPILPHGWNPRSGARRCRLNA